MGKGVLEVHLVDAKGLSGNDFLGASVRGSVSHSLPLARA
jgi:hypothetical protein